LIGTPQGDARGFRLQTLPAVDGFTDGLAGTPSR
jgi:hypothetical protein